MTAAHRLRDRVLDPLKARFVGRDEVIDLIALAACAGEHLFLYGPPGTAKSLLVRSFAQALRGRYFEYLLTRFSEPNELFGPIDLVKLREGTVATVTAGMLPEAEFAFLDELFNANSAILNNLLTVLNERTYRRGAQTHKLPLLTAFAASNQLPEDDALSALFDRFLLRCRVDALPRERLPALLAAGWGLERGEVETAADAPSADDLRELARQTRAVDLAAVLTRYADAVGRGAGSRRRAVGPARGEGLETRRGVGDALRPRDCRSQRLVGVALRLGPRRAGRAAANLGRGTARRRGRRVASPARRGPRSRRRRGDSDRVGRGGGESEGRAKVGRVGAVARAGASLGRPRGVGRRRRGARRADPPRGRITREAGVSEPLPGATAARLPAASLGALAPARDLGGVRVHLDGENVWVTWPDKSPRVGRLLVGVFGAEFFARRGPAWHRLNRRLPTSDAPPTGDGVPLTGAILPGRVTPTPPPATGPTTAVTLARGGPVRAASAAICPLDSLADWAMVALPEELAAVRVAVDGRRAIVLGTRLPSLQGGVRFWGDDVLIPLGFRLSPELPDAVARGAAGAGPGELLIVAETGAEVVPRSAFAAATRAGLRLAGVES